jgi:hypothetical protein
MTTKTLDLPEDDWFDESESDGDICEYDLTSTPNDFNVLTIFQFIESGAVKIPGFQRNYVWDIVRASKLVESLVMGLPVPQIFLYEEKRNSFLVIDGQQRLMSIYYFLKQRFPKKEKRVELRHIFDEKGGIPDSIFQDDDYFRPFKLSLPSKLADHANRYHGMKYATMGEYKTVLDLRPIRNVIVKQNSPTDDDSSVYEIFNRLNSGGVNLSPQEIRSSMYHSDFYGMIQRMNMESEWRRLLRQAEPDIHMKDVELLLRGVAMLVDADNYKPSMVRFLNRFSKNCRNHTDDQNQFIEQLIRVFFAACNGLPDDLFIGRRTKKFNVALFEAVFTAICKRPFTERQLAAVTLDPAKVRELSADKEFLDAAQKATTDRSNVLKRLERADAILDN